MPSYDPPGRFPRIPHLPNSAVIDDDRVMEPAEIAELCASCQVVVQEKVDGANVGIMFDDDGRFVCLKRAGVIGQRRERPQYGFFRNWVSERADTFWRILGTRWIAYGELLWTRHSVDYTRLPDWVILYDLVDRESGSFDCAVAVTERLGSDFAVVPPVWTGHLHWPFHVTQLFATALAQSAYADGPSEGLVLRFETDRQLVARAKYRSPGFEPGRCGEPTHNRLVKDRFRCRRHVPGG